MFEPLDNLKTFAVKSKTSLVINISQVMEEIDEYDRFMHMQMSSKNYLRWYALSKTTGEKEEVVDDYFKCLTVIDFVTHIVMQRIRNKIGFSLNNNDSIDVALMRLDYPKRILTNECGLDKDCIDDIISICNLGYDKLTPMTENFHNRDTNRFPVTDKEYVATYKVKTKLSNLDWHLIHDMKYTHLLFPFDSELKTDGNNVVQAPYLTKPMIDILTKRNNHYLASLPDVFFKENNEKIDGTMVNVRHVNFCHDSEKVLVDFCWDKISSVIKILIQKFPSVKKYLNKHTKKNYRGIIVSSGLILVNDNYHCLLLERAIAKNREQILKHAESFLSQFQQFEPVNLRLVMKLQTSTPKEKRGDFIYDKDGKIIQYNLLISSEADFLSKEIMQSIENIKER